MSKPQKVTIKSTGQTGFVRFTRLELGTQVFFLQDAQGKRIFNGQFSGWNEEQLDLHPVTA